MTQLKQEPKSSRKRWRDETFFFGRYWYQYACLVCGFL